MTSRREFIRSAALATASLSLTNVIPSFAVSRKGSPILGANDRIRLGVIGVNSRGSALAQSFAKMPGCDVTYICDCDTQALERCRQQVKALTGKLPKGETYIRRMLESDEFDAAVIAMPDHWHAKAAIMAMKAGKHVYLEKPTSHNPAENELLVRAAVKYGKVIQVGNQRRSWPNIIAAIDEIKLDTLSLADLKAAETFTYDIPLPDGVDNLSGVTSVTLTILFDDIDSLTVDATQFGYENLTTERDVTVVTSTLSVTLRGTSTALARVNEENLRVVADLTNVSDADGVYTVPATVYVDGLDVGAVGSYQVTVRLSGGAENGTEHN